MPFRTPADKQTPPSSLGHSHRDQGMRPDVLREAHQKQMPASGHLAIRNDSSDQIMCSIPLYIAQHNYRGFYVTSIAVALCNLQV